MKACRITLFLSCMIAVPLFAADRTFDLTGWAAWVDTNSNGTFNSSTPNQPFDVNFDGKLGYGAGVNLFFGGRTSLAVDVVEMRTDTTIRSRATGGGSLASGGLRITPITGVLQFHFAPAGFIDPYVGAGAAYVLLDNVNGRGNLNVQSINFKKDVGLALNAGVGIRLTPRLALTADGKYVPLKSSATAIYTNTATRTEARLKLNPVIFSGGLTFRF